MATPKKSETTPVDAERVEMKLPDTARDKERTYNEVPERHFSIILWLLIGILALLLVGLIMWYFALEEQAETAQPISAERPSAEMNREPESRNAVADVDAFGTMSTSDELSAIAADLHSTRLESLDAERGAIEAELERSR